MDLSIIIITHNSLVPVERCLAALAAHPPACEHEIIVIDNASSDGTPEMVSSKFGDCILVANPDNRGYSRGVNQGIDISSSGLILILNPDIEVREGSIDVLISFMRDNPDAGMCGSRLLYPDGRLQYSCRSFYTVKALFLRRTFLGRLFPRAMALREHLLTDYDHEHAREVDWLIGACLMVRRDAVEKVGLMDERFFLYFEDTDWCYRMHHHGWKVWYVPESVMIHSYERSSAKSVFRKPFILHLLSLLRYYEKWNRLFYFFRRNRSALKSFVFVLSDFLAVNAGFFAAYYLRGMLQPLFTNSLYPLDWYAYFILFYNLIFFLTFLFAGLYSIRRETGGPFEFSRITRSVLTVFAILLGATYLTRIRIYSRAVLLGQAFFTILTVFGMRRLIRLAHAQLVKASFDLKRVALAGTQQEIDEFSGLIAAKPELGMDVVGSIGHNRSSLGEIENIEDIVENFKIQEIIVLPSSVEDGTATRFLTGAGPKMPEIRLVSPAARFIGGSVRVQKLGDYHMFSIEKGAQNLLTRGMMRICDFFAGLLSLPLVLLFELSYRAIARSKSKTRFFVEERSGYNSRKLMWPRVVRESGREASDLVKSRLCLGLISGRLSLVGTPPLTAGQSRDAGGAGRFKPGITGSWRIEQYGDWKNALEDEILDARNRSFSGYIEILFRSINYFLSGTYPGWFFSKGEDR